MTGPGELAGLAAAGFWACASLFYSRTKLTAWQINFGKNLLASVVLLVHLSLVTLPFGRSLFQADLRTTLLLAGSSIFGILVGDTFYFRSLQILGPRRALIVSTASPLFATTVGWMFLHESLTSTSLLGILMTLGGILIVISERSDGQEMPGLFPSTIVKGVLCGLAGAVCNAGGATLSHIATHGAVDSGSQGCDALEATVIRVCVAAAGSLLSAIAAGRLKPTMSAAFEFNALKSYGPAVICGPWLGIWMSQIAYRNSLLAIAITLTCTTPLFAMPLTRILYGHRMTIRGLLGAVVALTGVYLTVASSSRSMPPSTPANDV